MGPSKSKSLASPSPRLHGVFLDRAATPGEVGGGLALGGFLTMRLIDQFASGLAPRHPDALGYQLRATREYLLNLQPRGVEVEQLLEIVRIAQAAAQRPSGRLLFAPLLAYAYWLEQELRIEEALDVLGTVLSLSDGRDAEEELGAIYQRARLLRKQSRYDESMETYEEAGQMALRLQDRHTELLSRIGCAIVLEKVGNLPEAERLLGTVIVEAVAAGDHDAEARARHDLANTLMMMERPADAVSQAYRAYERYQLPQQRLRALSDLGMAFKMLGDYSAAEDAFQVVIVEPGASGEIRLNAMLELLHVAALAQDRVSFERWRRELTGREAHMPPDARIDFLLKLGIGFGVFGSLSRAEQLLRSAIEQAEAHCVNAYLFQAEAALQRLVERDRTGEPASAPCFASESEGAETQLVAGRLRALRARVV